MHTKEPKKEKKGHNIASNGQTNIHHGGWRHKKTVCEVRVGLGTFYGVGSRQGRI